MSHAAIIASEAQFADYFSLELVPANGNYCTFPQTPGLPINADFTFEAWVKLASDADSNWIFTSNNAVAHYWGLIPLTGGIHGLCVQIDIGTGIIRLCSGAATILVADGWSHVAFTRSGNSYSLLINGVVVKTDSNSTITFPTIGQELGGLVFGAFNIHFDGKLDEVRLWSIVRTPAEILGAMRRNLSGNETGLEAYWRLESDYLDLTANNNDLTKHGSVDPAFSSDTPY